MNEYADVRQVDTADKVREEYVPMSIGRVKTSR